MTNDARDWLIYIIGSQSMQSELLASFLEKETGLPCRIEEGDGLLPQKIVDNRRSIIFSNCRRRSAKDILRRLRDFKCHQNDDFYIILFNLGSSLNIEEEVLALGVWGVFYEEDSSENLPRGVDAIRNGEIWLSRQIMSTCLVNMRRREGGQEQERFILSKREREVLQQVAAGFSNDEIANKLCLSIHTVRSHIYRIFKKVKVTNRQQAAIWAGRHL